MRAMIDGALAFFRNDAANEAPTMFDLPGVLDTIVNDCADQHIDVRYIGPSHITCWGRPLALKRAFTNLVENAIRYATPPEIELSCESETVVVEIRDRGPGIPPSAFDHVFDPYYRLDKSRNPNSGGFGLGLTAAQAIVREHGGDIILSNRAEGGLKASVTLPRIERSPRADRTD
jgi:signal transduction histidine kinase